MSSLREIHFCDTKITDDVQRHEFLGFEKNSSEF